MEKKESPTILLVNFHSAHNAGDAALLECAIHQLQNSFSNPTFIVSSNYPDETFLQTLKVNVVPSFSAIVNRQRNALGQVISFAIGFILSLFISKLPMLPDSDHRESLSTWRRLWKAYHEADLVVGCPGNQFFSMGRFGFPFLLSAMSVLLAHAFRKPFYVMPQSIGPLKRFWERWLIKNLYGKARIIYVRDNITLDLVRKLGLPSQKIRCAPDLAFDYSFAELETDKLPNAFLSHDPQYGAIGVTIIRKMTRTLRSEDIEHYYYSMAVALKRMIQQHNVHVYFFPQVTGPTPWEDDRIAAQSVIHQMEEVQQKISLIEEPLTPRMLKLLYGYMDIFIAGRLHSGIFALSRGVPTLFIGYLTKTRGVTDSIGLSDWVLDFTNLSEHNLYSKIEELWLKRASVKEHLLKNLPTIVNHVRIVGQEIANDYKNLP